MPLSKLKGAKNFAGMIVKGFSHKSPEILVGLGIVGGIIITPALAVKATPKAMELLEEKKDELDTDKLTVSETVKTVWKLYLPAVATGAISAGCIVLSSRENHRRNAALAAAYSLSEKALKDYQDKTLEVVGEKKVQEIHDKIAQDKLNRNPVENSTVIVTGNGKARCFEPITNTRFESDIETIRRTVNTLNTKLRRENYITLNEYLIAIGLKPTNISSVGEDLGWHSDCGEIDLKYSAMLDTDGVPCLVLGFYNGSEPVYLKDYR